MTRVDSRRQCTLKPFGHTCDCRRCQYGEHCGSHDTGCHQGCKGVSSLGDARRRVFEVYRPREHTRGALGKQPAGRPRFTGMVMPSGRVVVEWGPPVRSISQYESLTACLRVHAHAPDYGSFVRWLTPGPAVLPAQLGIPEVLDGQDADDHVRQLLGGRDAIATWMAGRPGETETLRAALRELHVAAGKPSTRAVAAAANRPLSHTTVSLALRGGGPVPSWWVTKAITEVLNGDVNKIHDLWVQSVASSNAAGD